MIIMGDNLALLEAATEREDIVKRYDRGRDPDAPIDDWEDPKLEVYHKTDRFGFIHEQAEAEAFNISDQKRVDKENERVDKWIKMFKAWDKYTNGEKLRKRIHKGIPERLRGEVWKKLLTVERQVAEHRGVYETMKERARTTSPDIRQIDLDVNRTYRNHIMFRERYGVKQTHLFHVLAAYSMYNTEVGYCQGMSQIAALLLMYMGEEEAFWGLSYLLTYKRHTMHGLFIPGFPKLLRFQTHFEEVLKKDQSKIYKFMQSNMIPASLYALKWFMQCYLDRTPFPLTLRLWDIYLLEGERMLIPMALTIFRLHKKRLLRMSMEIFVQFLQRDLELDFGYGDDEVVENLVANMEELRRNKRDIPRASANRGEFPTKPFGTIFFPTKEELIKRQEAQMHINDRQPTTVVEVTVNPAGSPKLIAQNSVVSQISHYDNSPVDVHLNPMYLSPEADSVLSVKPKVQKNSHVEMQVEAMTSSTDDSIREDDDSCFEEQFEKTMTSEEYNRSASASPELDSDLSASRMYVRAGGVRTKSRNNSEVSSRSNATSPLPPPPPSPPQNYQSNNGGPARPYKFPTSLKFVEETDLDEDLYSKPVPGVAVPGLDGTVELHISHEDLRGHGVSRSRKGVRSPSHSHDGFLMNNKSPVGLSPGHFNNRARPQSVSPHAMITAGYPGARPFPIPQQQSMPAEFVTRTAPHGQSIPMHMRINSPQSPQNPQWMQQQTFKGPPPLPQRNSPHSPPVPTRTPGYALPSFNTFGGRSRSQPPGNMAPARGPSMEEMNSFVSDSHPRIQTPPAVNTLPPKFAVRKQRTPNPNHPQKFYVLTDGSAKTTAGNQSGRYTYEYEEEQTHSAVFL